MTDTLEEGDLHAEVRAMRGEIQELKALLSQGFANRKNDCAIPPPECLANNET